MRAKAGMMHSDLFSMNQHNFHTVKQRKSGMISDKAGELLTHKHSDSKAMIKNERNTDLIVTGKHRRSNQSLYPNFADSNELVGCWYNMLEGSSFNDPARSIYLSPGRFKHPLVQWVSQIHNTKDNVFTTNLSFNRLDSYNTIGWKGPLEVTWASSLLRAGPT